MGQRKKEPEARKMPQCGSSIQQYDYEINELRRQGYKPKKIEEQGTPPLKVVSIFFSIDFFFFFFFSSIMLTAPSIREKSWEPLFPDARNPQRRS